MLEIISGTKMALSWEINVKNTTIFLQIITAPTLRWYFNLETKPVIQRCEFYSSQYWEENMRTWLSALFPSTVLQKMFFFTVFFSYCYWLISYHTHCGERFLNLQLRTVIYNRNILKRKLLWNNSSFRIKMMWTAEIQSLNYDMIVAVVVAI